MKASELRLQTVAELKEKHIDLLKVNFKLRMQKHTDQLIKVSEVKQHRRDIARILTVINEKIGSKDE